MAELFKGKKLFRHEGGKFVEVEASSLEGKKVGIYFSAHWCPPCRMFTPILKDFYEELQNAGKPFEIIFVSSDRSEKEQEEYMNEAHGPWMTLLLSDPFVKDLKQKYGVTGIPTFVIVKSNGDVITKDGRGDVTKGPKSYDGW